MFSKIVLKSISGNRRFCYRGASKWKVPFALCWLWKKHQKTFEGCLHLDAICVIRVMLLVLFWSLGHREIVRQVVKINEIQGTLTIPWALFFLVFLICWCALRWQHVRQRIPATCITFSRGSLPGPKNLSSQIARWVDPLFHRVNAHPHWESWLFQKNQKKIELNFDDDVLPWFL